MNPLAGLVFVFAAAIAISSGIEVVVQRYLRPAAERLIDWIVNRTVK